MENTNAPAPDAQDAEKGKTIAILSYVTLVGWVIAYIMHTSTKTKFGAYHLRQGLGLMILSVGIYVISFGILFVSYTMYHLFSFINIGVFALAIMGIINAANGKTQAIPVLGDFFDKTFSGIN